MRCIIGVVQNQSKIVNDNRVLTNEVQSLRAEVGRANDRMVIKIAQLNASMSSGKKSTNTCFFFGCATGWFEGVYCGSEVTISFRFFIVPFIVIL